MHGTSVQHTNFAGRFKLLSVYGVRKKYLTRVHGGESMDQLERLHLEPSNEEIARITATRPKDRLNTIANRCANTWEKIVYKCRSDLLLGDPRSCPSASPVVHLSSKRSDLIGASSICKSFFVTRSSSPCASFTASAIPPPAGPTNPPLPAYG